MARVCQTVADHRRAAISRLARCTDQGPRGVRSAAEGEGQCRCHAELNPNIKIKVAVVSLFVVVNIPQRRES